MPQGFSKKLKDSRLLRTFLVSLLEKSSKKRRKAGNRFFFFVVQKNLSWDDLVTKQVLNEKVIPSVSWKSFKYSWIGVFNTFVSFYFSFLWPMQLQHLHFLSICLTWMIWWNCWVFMFVSGKLFLVQASIIILAGLSRRVTVFPHANYDGEWAISLYDYF